MSFTSLFVILIISLIVVAVLRMSSKPKEENFVQRWDAYIPGKKDAGEEYLTLAEQEFSKRNAGFSKERINFGLAGNSAPALRIVYNSLYSSYFTYKAIGDDLTLHYILYRKNGGLFYQIPLFGKALFRLLNAIYVHEHTKLIGFASMTIDCAKEAAGNLMDQFNIDKSKKLKPSSGLLEPL